MGTGGKATCAVSLYTRRIEQSARITNRILCIHWMQEWVYPWASLDIVAERKTQCVGWELNTGPPVFTVIITSLFGCPPHTLSTPRTRNLWYPVPPSFSRSKLPILMCRHTPFFSVTCLSWYADPRDCGRHSAILILMSLRWSHVAVAARDIASKLWGSVTSLHVMSNSG
jgi:hypothetical protein